MSGCGCAACNRGTPHKGYFSEEVVTLETALDRHPCKHCGGHYNEHFNLSQAEIDDAQDQGCDVRICEVRRRWTFDNDELKDDAIETRCREDRAYFCTVTKLPNDPCDVDFMKEIST